MKKISIIVAVASNGAIGKDNDLLWHIPEDFQWFKKHTKGNTVIMGRNTWESLPVRPLKGRTNIVISDRHDDEYEGCTVVSSIDEAIKEMSDERENFIIGGGSIYRQFLPLADKFYLTRVHREFDADVFFPDFNKDQWKEVFREDHPENESQSPGYSFIIYDRVSDQSRQ
jgi:dihydrofolate reductase